MNEFYHEFTIGFNWWYIMMPLLAAVVAGYGFFIVAIIDGKVGYKTTISPDLPAIIAGIIVTVLLFVESYDGCLQFWRNAISRDGFSTPRLETVITILLTGFIYVLIVAKLGEITMRAHRRHLKKIVKQIEKKVYCQIREQYGDYVKQLYEDSQVLKKSVNIETVAFLKERHLGRFANKPQSGRPVKIIN